MITADHIVLEPARPDQADVAAQMIWDTDPHLFHFVSGGDQDSFLALYAHLWQADKGFTSHKNTTAAYDGDGNLMGIEIGVPADEDHLHFDAMGDAAEGFHDQDFTNRLFSNFSQSNPLFPKWPKGGYYLAHLAAHPDARGRGIGDKLIQNCFESARAAGHSAVALDVEGQNSAVRFYERQGMTRLIETRVPRLDDDHGLGKHFRMQLDLP